MKKFFAVLCALLLCLSGFSFAEQVDAAAFPETVMMKTCPFSTLCRRTEARTL